MKSKILSLGIFWVLLCFVQQANAQSTFYVTVPEETVECYIVGAADDSWTIFREMERVDATHFKLYVEGTSDSNWIAYYSGQGYDYVGLDSEGNEYDMPVVIGDNYHTVDHWKNLYDPNMKYTYTVNVPEGTNACYMIGDGTGWGTFQKLERIGETNQFTITISDFGVFQLASGPGWEYVECPNVGDACLQTDEITHTGTGGTYTVVGWKNVWIPNVYTVNAPEGTYACYMIGDATGDIDWGTWLEMKRVGETNTFTIQTEFDGEFELASGPDWEYKECTNASGECVDEVHTGPGTYNVIRWNSVYVPAGTHSYTYTVNTPEGTNACYMVGDPTGDPSWESWLELERVGETNQFTITTDYTGEFQLASGPDWDYVECTNASGECLQTDEIVHNGAGTYTVLRWKTVYSSNGSSIIKMENRGMNIYVSDGRIVANNISGSVSLYTVAGQCIQRETAVNGIFISKELPKGIYILRSGDLSAKVAIQ